jgi:hypothetical protein
MDVKIANDPYSTGKLLGPLNKHHTVTEPLLDCRQNTAWHVLYNAFIDSCSVIDAGIANVRSFTTKHGCSSQVLLPFQP